MANYKSSYTGQEIDAGIAKANTAVQDVSDKQDILVSGTNIKTINNTSILGSGNITIEGGSGGGISQEAGNLLINILRAGVYTSKQDQNILDFIEAMGIVPTVSNIILDGEELNYDYQISNDDKLSFVNEEGIYKLKYAGGNKIAVGFLEVDVTNVSSIKATIGNCIFYQSSGFLAVVDAFKNAPSAEDLKVNFAQSTQERTFTLDVSEMTGKKVVLLGYEGVGSNGAYMNILKVWGAE